MTWFRTFLLLAIATSAFASEPKDVAESAMRPWVSQDGKALYPLSHPELIARMRNAPVIQYAAARHPKKQAILKSGSDAEIVELLCDSLAFIVPPRDGQFIYEDRYVDTKVVGDLAVVTFASSVTSAGSTSKAQSYPTKIVLKRKDGQWLFLWSPAVNLYVDLEWDPCP